MYVYELASPRASTYLFKSKTPDLTWRLGDTGLRSSHRTQTLRLGFYHFIPLTNLHQKPTPKPSPIHPLSVFHPRFFKPSIKDSKETLQKYRRHRESLNSNPNEIQYWFQWRQNSAWPAAYQSGGFDRYGTPSILASSRMLSSSLPRCFPSTPTLPTLL